MTPIFLFPSEPFNVKNVDDGYSHEYEYVVDKAQYFFVDIETLNDNVKFSNHIQNLSGHDVIYRGWMLKPQQYENLYKALKKHNLNLITSPEKYLFSHYISHWYESLKNFTIDTVFSNEQNLLMIAQDFKGQKIFVKDCVKSLTTLEGSIAQDIPDLMLKVQRLKQTRGEIEGSIVLRKVVELKTDCEERYFVYKGKAYAREGDIPSIVQQIALKHDAEFYSVDIAQLKSGQDILIEIGDGQVSDIKKWTVDKFYCIFS